MTFGGAPYGSSPFGDGDEDGTGASLTGDSLRDAFRLWLDSTLALQSWIEWPHKDTLATGEKPDASTGYFELEFPGGGEDQYTFGAPGNNFFLERGQVTLRAVFRLNAGAAERNKAERYIEALRQAFRSARFAAGTRTVRVTATGAMGGGETEGGMWAESIAIAYQTFNLG